MSDDPRPMFDWYTRFYAAIGASQANAAYCQQVYGKNLCQHGFAEMAHLDHLIAVCALHENDHVLDLGCGNGRIAEYISAQTGARVTGIDFIDLAIRDAQVRTQDRRDRLTFHVMDMGHPDFPPASFDAVISIDTLYFGDVTETLRPVAPLLKPGGRLAAFFDQSCGPHIPLEDYPRGLIDPDNTELAQALQQLGLTYQSWDYTAEMIQHLQRRKPVLAALEAQFEAEGNGFLYDSHLAEANGIEHAYLNGAGRRYLYRAQL